jgi:hypothetical protein
MESLEYALREENRLLFHKMLSECCKKEKIVDFTTTRELVVAVQLLGLFGHNYG